MGDIDVCAINELVAVRLGANAEPVRAFKLD